MADQPPRACLGARPVVRPPARALPEGAWDMHFHVLGPQAQFPYAANRRYTPPDAPLAAALAFHDALGIARGLVVHANTHGFDNAVDLDAAARSNGRYLAVVRLDGSATPERCRALAAQGARGVRFAFNPQHGGTLDHAVFDTVIRAIAGLDWFVELHFEGEALPELAPWISAIPAPVVIDHYGRVALGAVGQAAALLDLAARRHIWIKLSGTDRLVEPGASIEPLARLTRRLVEVAGDRLVWGSDWPHTGVFDAERMPDDSELVDRLAELVPDAVARERILVRNPLRLLGLTASQ